MSLLPVHYTVDCIVSFSQSAYFIDENAGQIQLALILSNPSSTDITVAVLNEDIMATGKHTKNIFSSLIVLSNHTSTAF